MTERRRPEVLAALGGALRAAAGPRGWWPAQPGPHHRDEVIVGAILTQNTAWRNVERALDRLRELDAIRLPRLHALPRAELAAAIRPSGYFNLKAQRLHDFTAWCAAACAFDLPALARRPTADLRADLLGVRGIGPETADSILLYALGHPVFVIDAYTRRILARHGWARGDEPYEVLRARFERTAPPQEPPAARVARWGDDHAQFVHLAAGRCRKAAPDCAGCPLADRRWFASDVAHRAALAASSARAS